MKTRFAMILMLWALLTQAFATTVINHPSVKQHDSSLITTPGYCQIEVINQRSLPMLVEVTYDDGSYVNFGLNPAQTGFVNMFYYGACHRYAFVRATTPYEELFAGQTLVQSTLRP